MANQSNNRVLVAIQRETVPGTMATDAPGSASRLRIIDSPGLELARAQIQSAEKRPDQIKPMPRLGGRSADGSYNVELTIGGALDICWEAIMRGTWSAASDLVTANNGAQYTSIRATATNTLALAGTGSLITAGYKVGDIIRPKNMTTAANNGLNLRVTAVADSTITVAGTPLTVEGAGSTTAALTRLKKVVNPSTVPTRYSHTVEEHDLDIDLSEVFRGQRLVGFSLDCKPDSPIQCTLTFKGLDAQTMVTGTSPYFTTPTLTTGQPLVDVDGIIRYAGNDVAVITGWKIDFQIETTDVKVVTSQVRPDIYDDDLTITTELMMIRTDFGNRTKFDNETLFEVSLLAQEPNTSPLACVSIFLPAVKLLQVGAPIGGGSGAKVETLKGQAGPLVASATYDGGAATIYSSAP